MSMTTTEMIRRAGLNPTTAARMIERLVSAGVLRDRRRPGASSGIYHRWTHVDLLTVAVIAELSTPSTSWTGTERETRLEAARAVQTWPNSGWLVGDRLGFLPADTPENAVDIVKMLLPSTAVVVCLADIKARLEPTVLEPRTDDDDLPEQAAS